MISNELKPFWNGNHVYAEIKAGEEKDNLTISIISHTLPNLLETSNWYERRGAKEIYEK